MQNIIVWNEAIFRRTFASKKYTVQDKGEAVADQKHKPTEVLNKKSGAW